MKRLLNVFILIICFSLLAPFFSKKVTAQQVGLTLSPSLTEIISKPGHDIKLNFNLENTSDPALVSLKLRSFLPVDSTGRIKINSTNTSRISFDINGTPSTDQTTFIMKTHETKNIELMIHVPSDLTEKDYYFSLIAQTDPPPPTEGNISARASIAISSNILISISKTYPAEPQSKITLFEIPNSFHMNMFGKKWNLVNSEKPLNFIVELNNAGLFRIKPDGIITIANNFGYQKMLTIPPQNVLSASQRILTVSNSPSTPKQTFILNSLSPGLYTLSAKIAFPNSDVIINNRLTFLSIPYTLVFLLSIFLIIVIVFIFSRSKKSNEFEEE